MRTTEDELDDEFAAVLTQWENLQEAILRMETAAPAQMTEAVQNLREERRHMQSDMLGFHRRLGELAARSGP